VQKTKYKIFVLFLLLSSVFTIDGYEFLHNHNSESENHCLSCLLSSSLIANDCDSGSEIVLNIFPEITFQFEYNTNLLSSDYTNASDRAPPLA
jgi:hypothetical protein